MYLDFRSYIDLSLIRIRQAQRRLSHELLVFVFWFLFQFFVVSFYIRVFVMLRFINVQVGDIAVSRTMTEDVPLSQRMFNAI